MQTSSTKGKIFTEFFWYFAEYVASLEKEVQKLKHEKRDLAEKVAVAEKFGRLAMQPPPDSEPILAEVKDSNVKNHIHSLNDMLGKLFSWQLLCP